MIAFGTSSSAPTRWLITAAILLFVIIGPTSSSHGADVFVTVRSEADLDELVRFDYSLFTRQRVAHFLSIRGHRLFGQGSDWSDRDAMRFVLQGRLETDFLRPVSSNSDDLREREPVDLVLQRAFLLVSPVDELTIRVGRLIAFGPIAPLDLDGFSFLVSSPLIGGSDWEWSSQLDLGREVVLDRLGLQSDLFDLPGSRWTFFGQGEPESTWVGQASLGLTSQHFDMALGHQLRLRHDDLIGQSSGLQASLDLAPIASHISTRWDHYLERPSRIDASVTIPFVALSSSVYLGWHYRLPIFDGDSIFSVFSHSPSVGWRLRYSLQPTDGLRLSLDGNLTGFETEGETPWLGGLGGSAAETARGGGLQARFHALPTVQLSADLGISIGYNGLLVSDGLGANWGVVPDFIGLEARIRHQYRDPDNPDRGLGHLIGIRLRGTFELGTLGQAVTWAEVVDDYRQGPNLSLMAAVQFDLGPF